jgi:pimeloyl-ACP methyl ester carboxylesterase
MRVDGAQATLVQVTTADGLRLHGAFQSPAADDSVVAADQGSAVDVWLCIHGTGSSFYAASTLAGLAPKLLAGGSAVLRANTRGHDLVSTGPAGHGPQGAAFERVADAPLDLRAWIDFLSRAGFRRIGLLGHSLGAIKAVITLAADDAPEVARLVAVSPPRLSHGYFCQTPRGDEFRQTFAAAQDRVAAGHGEDLMWVRFPLAYYVSAAGYVDRYGPDEHYNVLPHLGRVRVPTLVTYGSSEVQSDLAFRGMPEAAEQCATAANHLRVAVIAGADHIYTACHDALAERIAAWLRRS